MTYKLLVDVVGWIGAVVLLTAYGAVSSGKLEGTSSRYQILNAVGSAFLIVNAAYYRAFPSAFVNLVWIGIALSAILASRSSRRTRHREPDEAQGRSRCAPRNP